MAEQGRAPLEIPALHELEMVSPWFDASTPATPCAMGEQASTAYGPSRQRRLLLLLSIPRSGSYHLCRLLWHLGYGKPTEYFNPSLQPHLDRFQPRAAHRHQRLAERLHRFLKPQQPSQAWLQHLIQERTASSTITGQSFFACKLQPDQLGPLPKALKKVFAPLTGQGLWQPFSALPPALVMLYRHNWKAMVLSHHLARCSGSFDQRRLFTHQHRSIAQLGQREALLADLACGRRHLEALVSTLQTSPHPIHLLRFEQLLSAQTESLAALIQQIDAAAPPLNMLMSDPRLSVRIARTPDPWASATAQWQTHLQERFAEEGLPAHPDALACDALIAQLDAIQ